MDFYLPKSMENSLPLTFERFTPSVVVCVLESTFLKQGRRKGQKPLSLSFPCSIHFIETKNFTYTLVPNHFLEAKNKVTLNNQ